MSTATPNDIDLSSSAGTPATPPPAPAPAPARRATVWDFTAPWWLFVVTGLAWIMVSLFVLQFDLTTVWSISLLFAGVMIAATVEEAVHAVYHPSWRLAHAALALLFAAGTLWALFYPGQTFRTLALLVGWFLLIKGIFNIVLALAGGGPFWLLTLITGVVEIGLAFWATGHPERSTLLLVLWVGLAALFRGFQQLVLAFELRADR